MSQPPHVVLLPSPGMGHLTPMVEFAKLLVHNHHFSATIAVPTTGPPTEPEKLLFESLPKSINYVRLPPVDLPDGLDIRVQFMLTIKHSLLPLRDTMASLKATTPLVALVIDLFGSEAFDVANEIGVAKYLLFPTNAMVLSFLFYLPKLDKSTTCEYRDLPEPVKLPGCDFSISGGNLLDPIQNRSSQVYKLFLRNVKRYVSADGIILNSFMELEDGVIKALQADTGLPIYPVGPIIQPRSLSDPIRPECLTWLDGQPNKSVVFVSFGSRGTPNYSQITEIALGLELSGQKFLWVVRNPGEESNSLWTAQGNPLDYLPEGFLGRTKEQGLVIPFWAPQIEVLSHGSVGGFVTHCGWNSTQESIVHGVPLIAWPLYSEQKMNATMLTKGMNVALSLEKNEDGIVEREEIAKVVRDLMENGEGGMKVREKMNILMDGAKEAVGNDGSSTRSLAELASNWRKLMI